MEGKALPTTMILSLEFAQGGFDVVHWKVLLPTPKPVIVVAGLFGAVIAPPTIASAGTNQT